MNIIIHVLCIIRVYYFISNCAEPFSTGRRMHNILYEYNIYYTLIICTRDTVTGIILFTRPNVYACETDPCDTDPL